MFFSFGVCECCGPCVTVCCDQAGQAEVQRLRSEMIVEVEKHQRELEAVRQQYKREVEGAQKWGFSQCKTTLK